jgi:hypothetical protein
MLGVGTITAWKAEIKKDRATRASGKDTPNSTGKEQKREGRRIEGKT